MRQTHTYQVCFVRELQAPLSSSSPTTSTPVGLPLRPGKGSSSPHPAELQKRYICLFSEFLVK